MLRPGIFADREEKAPTGFRVRGFRGLGPNVWGFYCRVRGFAAPFRPELHSPDAEGVSGFGV